ncbi:MAG: SIS domain-containing protein [Candidatus Micrarchaeota archaeon]|nr:SIS domain-containing protein [Candidatus Micrarchaeota archaeon]
MVNIKNARDELISSLSKINEESIIQAASLIADAFKKNKKLLVAGNGGSAADAQHFVTELVCTFEKKERKALPAIALTTNSSILTAWSNDFSFETVFERQILSLANKEDIFFSISTSGNSKNIIKSMQTAKKIGLTNILLTGQDGGKAKQFADLVLFVNSNNVQRIQECHIFILHQLCSLIEREFYEK